MAPPPPSAPSAKPTILTTPRPPINSPRPPTIAFLPPTKTTLSPRRIAPRPLILSLSIAAIAATGAYYGASLKTSRDTQTAVKQHLTASPEARIAYLEERRARMVGVKRGLEERIGSLQTKIQKG